MMPISASAGGAGSSGALRLGTAWLSAPTWTAGVLAASEEEEGFNRRKTRAIAKTTTKPPNPYIKRCILLSGRRRSSCGSGKGIVGLVLGFVSVCLNLLSSLLQHLAYRAVTVLYSRFSLDRRLYTTIYIYSAGAQAAFVIHRMCVDVVGF